MPKVSTGRSGPKFEIVLKCDSIGSLEAVTGAVSEIEAPGVDIAVIHSGIGTISKSDVLFAETASRFIAGFQVDVMQGLDRTLREHRVDVRLYRVIYALTADMKKMAEGMAPSVPEEEITGSAKVIAVFKSSRKGMIIGCDVSEGHLAVGQRFRIFSGMGPIYAGTIESLHIAENAVQKATSGQRVGIRIRNFNKARVGDLVESYRLPHAVKTVIWQPAGRIIHV